MARRTDLIPQDSGAGVHVLIQSLFCLMAGSTRSPALAVTEPCRNVSQNREIELKKIRRPFRPSVSSMGR